MDFLQSSGLRGERASRDHCWGGGGSCDLLEQGLVNNSRARAFNRTWSQPKTGWCAGNLIRAVRALQGGSVAAQHLLHPTRHLISCIAAAGALSYLGCSCA